MKGTRVKCPQLVYKATAWSLSGQPLRKDTVICGCETYDIIEPHPFTKDSGLDPLAVKVKCKECGCEYYVFPALTFAETKGE